MPLDSGRRRRDQVFADPCLRPILRRLRFEELAGPTAALTR